MFVRQSKYDEMELHALRYEHAYRTLLSQWNAMVRKINARGGESFLNKGVMPEKIGLSLHDVQRLIQLCHPDKHDGKQSATEMTQKLLELKERLSE